MKTSQTYRIFSGMKTRCSNPKNRLWKWYGGRGIEVHYANLAAFISDVGERPPGMTIERIDVNGHYEPGNCRWATRQEQANNTRANVFLTIHGKRKTLSQWAATTGIGEGTLRWRLKHGTPEAAIIPGRRTENRARGERINTAKLTADKVLAIRSAFAAGAKNIDLARSYGITLQGMRAVTSGKTWRDTLCAGD